MRAPRRAQRKMSLAVTFLEKDLATALRGKRAAAYESSVISLKNEKLLQLRVKDKVKIAKIGNATMDKRKKVKSLKRKLLGKSKEDQRNWRRRKI